MTQGLNLQSIYDDGLSEKSQELRTSALEDSQAGSDAPGDGGQHEHLSPEKLLMIAKEKVAMLTKLNEEGTFAGRGRRRSLNVMEQAATQVSVIDTYDLYVSAVW